MSDSNAMPPKGLSEKTRTHLAGCSSATLSTQLFKRGLRNQVLQGVSRLTPKAPPLVGEAFTLRNIPARYARDRGRVLPGVLNEATRARYEEWKRKAK